MFYAEYNRYGVTTMGGNQCYAFSTKKARNAWVEKHELDANNNVVARECTVKDVRRYYGEGFTAVHGIVEPEGEHTHTAEEAAHTIREYGQYEGDE